MALRAMKLRIPLSVEALAWHDGPGRWIRASRWFAVGFRKGLGVSGTIATREHVGATGCIAHACELLTTQIQLENPAIVVVFQGRARLQWSGREHILVSGRAMASVNHDEQGGGGETRLTHGTGS